MLYLSLSAESSVVCVVIIVDRLSLLFSEMRERGSPKIPEFKCLNFRFQCALLFAA